MPIDKFIIGYTDDKSGFQTNFQPWLLPDNAFESMINAYTWRGRVRKRIGSTLMTNGVNGSRLRIPGIPIVAGVITLPLNVAVGMQIEQQVANGATLTVWDLAQPLLTTNPAVTAAVGPGANEITIAGSVGTVFLYPALPVTGIGQYENPATNDETTVAFDTNFAYFYSGTDWQRLTGGADAWTGTNSQLFWIVNYRGVTANENYLWVTNFNAADGIRYRTAIAGGEWRKPTLFYSKGSIIGQTDGAGNFVGALGSPPVVGSVVIVASTAFVVLTGLLPAGFQPMGVVPLTTSAAVGTATCDFAAGNINIAASVTPAPNTNVYYSNQLLITTARIVVQFKNRLILLNTVENVGGVNTVFKNRCRFSAVGNPLFGTVGTVYTSVSFMQDLPGFGNAIDAATQEAIVSAEFLKDRLIVYFERSTWELVYTGNQIYPFTWQKINTELGAESTFSAIPFDKTVLGFGNVGIHSCTGANVVRIDEKIPDFIFNLHNQDAGLDRVVGIRNYQPEVAIWTYPGDDRDANFPYPNNLLVFNYVNNSWATFKDSYTFLGYYQTSATAPSPAATWGSSNTLWGETTDLWGGAVGTTNSIKTLKVIAGNQQGWVHILNSNATNNAQGLYITGVSNANGTVNSAVAVGDPIYIYCVDHNLELSEFVAINNFNGIVVTYTDPLGVVYTLSRFVAQVIEVVNRNQIRITAGKYDIDTNIFTPFNFVGTYVGTGNMARVSLININSKDFNLYVGKDCDAYISRINFMVDRTASNYIKVNYNLGTARGLGLPQDNLALLGNSQLETFPYALNPFEANQSQFWHNVYLSADGEFIQIQLVNDQNQPFNFTLSGNPATATTSYGVEQDFQMHSMIIYAQPTSSGLQ
jgi:hypothetical protein